MTHAHETPRLFYRTAQAIARIAWRFAGGIHVTGRENVPETGPVLLIANHQSILDPIFVQAVLRRPIYAMAKSTQFTVPVVGWMLRRVCAFPVRRYRVDPQAVRIALRRLEEGSGVAIYIEGERSWNARLQEPRIGTARLALRAGVPIVPVAITGTYEIWPRWDQKLRLGPAHITFRPAIRLPHLRGAANRRAAAAAAGTLMEELREALNHADPAATPA